MRNEKNEGERKKERERVRKRNVRKMKISL